MNVRRWRSGCGVLSVLSTMLGCAVEPSDEEGEPGQVSVESSDQIETKQSALSADQVPELSFAPLSLCKEFGSTYATAPWSSAWSGSARCVKQTITVPEMGFGTDHETRASFPEFTGLSLAQVGQPSVSDKCRAAGIRVKIVWSSEGSPSSTWNYVVQAKPVFGPIFSPSPSSPIVALRQVVSCTATHHSGLSGHGPGKFVISTSPFNGAPPALPSPLPSFRPMSSSVDPIF